MIRGVIGRIRSKLAGLWDLPEGAERIQGTGEAYLEPAYNGRYRAERELRELARAEEVGDEEELPGSVDPVHLER